MRIFLVAVAAAAASAAQMHPGVPAAVVRANRISSLRGMNGDMSKEGEDSTGTGTGTGTGSNTGTSTTTGSGGTTSSSSGSHGSSSTSSSSGGGHTTTSGGGGGGGGSCPAGSGTFCAFATDLLNYLQLPVTANNLVSFVGWFQAEGNSCQYNPLNTEDSAPGSSNCNSVGVQDFPSWTEGVQTIAGTLQNGYYNAILADLKASADPTTTGTDIANSPWGTGQLALECINDAKDPSTFAAWAAKVIDTSP